MVSIAQGQVQAQRQCFFHIFLRYAHRLDDLQRTSKRTTRIAQKREERERENAEEEDQGRDREKMNYVWKEAWTQNPMQGTC